MIDKLEIAEHRFEDVGRQLTQPDLMSDIKKFTALSKEYKELEKLVVLFREYRTVSKNYDESRELFLHEKDDELKQMAKEDLEILEPRKKELEETLRLMLIPKDPEDAKNAIIEIRAGTGGDEASLFAGELLRMYTRYCERRGWKVALLDESEGTVGGYKDVSMEVTGDDVYGTLKFESGVHRVQRVPDTEANGRVHTSAATVAVMPEADEIDFELKESDVKMETSRSGGAGGQKVNKKETKMELSQILKGVLGVFLNQGCPLGKLGKKIERKSVVWG